MNLDNHILSKKCSLRCKRFRGVGEQIFAPQPTLFTQAIKMALDSLIWLTMKLDLK